MFGISVEYQTINLHLPVLSDADINWRVVAYHTLATDFFSVRHISISRIDVHVRGNQSHAVMV